MNLAHSDYRPSRRNISPNPYKRENVSDRRAFSQENSSERKKVGIRIWRYNVDSIMISQAFAPPGRCLLTSIRIALREALEVVDTADFLLHIFALIEPQATARENGLSEWARGQVRVCVHTRHTRIAP